MINAIFIIFIIIVCLLLCLYTIKFIVEIVNEKIELDSRKIFKRAFISSLVLTFALPFFQEYVISKFDIFSKYTIIPTYVLFQLNFACIISSFIWFILIIINIFNDNNKDNKYELRNSDKAVSCDIDFIIRFKNELLKCFKFMNKTFNPIYTVDINKINIVKTVKSILLICYLVSGMIMVSCMTNKVNLDLKNDPKYEETINEIDFEKEVELYKDVFIISIIPFTITYIITKNKKKDVVIEDTETDDFEIQKSIFD